MGHNHSHHETTARKVNPRIEKLVQRGSLAILVLLTLLSLLKPTALSQLIFFAQDNTPLESSQNANGFQYERFFLGRVKEIISEGMSEQNPESKTQQILVEILSGEETGQTVEIQNDITAQPEEVQIVTKGEDIVLTATTTPSGTQYYVSEKFRLPAVMLTLLIFLMLIIVLAGGIKGISSFLGLAFSILVIALFIIPRVIAGDNPLVISFIGAVFIAIISLYLAHGFSHKSSIALGSTLITIVLSLLISILFVEISKLFGTGNEEALYLQGGLLTGLNLKGLLLGGITIGTLGVLDDVTTAQVAAVAEIKHANDSLGTSELYKRGLSIGHEHIASLVNTLVLAYAGGAMPLLLLFTVNKSIPFWVILNSEPIVEEIIRTLVGSIALVCAVPIATSLAAIYFGRKKAV